MNNLQSESINSLQNSPLFNVSLASKELFHSNFWAWCFEQNHEETALFFNKKINQINNELTTQKYPSLNASLYKVLREQNHYDLTLQFNDGYEIIIENKIKSIPNQDQLNRYSSELSSKENQVFFLLSIYEVKGLDNVHYLSYPELLVFLNDLCLKLERSLDENDVYKKGIYKDYTIFVNNLLHLTRDWEELEIFDFYSSFPVGKNQKNDYQIFHSLRLHDLFHKVKYKQLQDYLLETILKSIIPIKERISTLDYFSRGAGAATILYYLDDSEKMRIEMQIQDRMLKLMLVSKDCLKKTSKDNVCIHNIFRFLETSYINDVTEDQHFPKNGEYNKYGTDIIYRNKKLKHGLEIENLVRNLSAFFVEVIKQVEMDKDEIIEVLKD